VEVYDPETDTWTQLPDMPIAKSVINSNVIDNKIYVVGGFSYNTFSYFSSVNEYTPEGWKSFAVSQQGKLSSRWGKIKRE